MTPHVELTVKVYGKQSPIQIRLGQEIKLEFLLQILREVDVERLILTEQHSKADNDGIIETLHLTT